MKANIVITLDGQVNIVTTEGSFEAGSFAIEKLLSALNLDGLNISLEKPIEQHRHDGDGHLHAHSHADQGHSH